MPPCPFQKCVVSVHPSINRFEVYPEKEDKVVHLPLPPVVQAEVRRLHDHVAREHPHQVAENLERRRLHLERPRHVLLLE